MRSWENFKALYSLNILKSTEFNTSEPHTSHGFNKYAATELIIYKVEIPFLRYIGWLWLKCSLWKFVWFVLISMEWPVVALQMHCLLPSRDFFLGNFASQWPMISHIRIHYSMRLNLGKITLICINRISLVNLHRVYC